MQKTNLETSCGLNCGECKYFEKECKGCATLAGKPFWTTFMKVEVCPLYDCCINKKQLEHCGLCAEFPCESFQKSESDDPNLSAEQAQASALKRQKKLDAKMGK